MKSTELPPEEAVQFNFVWWLMGTEFFAVKVRIIGNADSAVMVQEVRLSRLAVIVN